MADMSLQQIIDLSKTFSSAIVVTVSANCRLQATYRINASSKPTQNYQL